jgi:PKD repeat protein
VASATPTTGTAPLNVNFTGSNSTDDTGISSSSWNFGDGTPASSLANPSHIFSSAGTFNVVLTVTDGGGLQATRNLVINVSGPPQNGVASFTLVESGPNSDLLTLANNLQISSSTVQGKNLNIRANTNPSIVGSVYFTLSGPITRTQLENTAPYALLGDNSGTFLGQPFPNGTYSLTAIAYSGSNRSGNTLGTLSLSFSIGTSGANKLASPSDAGSETAEAPIIPELYPGEIPVVYPNPTHSLLYINAPAASAPFVEFILFDGTGRLVKKVDAVAAKIDVQLYLLDLQALESGVYYLNIHTSGTARYHYQVLIKR